MIEVTYCGICGIAWDIRIYPECPYCTKDISVVKPFDNLSDGNITIQDRDIYAGLMYAEKLNTTYIETVRRLREEGYWKASSYIENNKKQYENNKGNFVYVGLP